MASTSHTNGKGKSKKHKRGFSKETLAAVEGGNDEDVPSPQSELDKINAEINEKKVELHQLQDKACELDRQAQIKRRRSHSGHLTCVASGVDKRPFRNLLEIFKEEIWHLILDNLTNQKDVISCYHTCPQFQTLLGTRVRGEALLTMNTYLKDFKGHRNLQMHDFLTCRLVCKSWKQTVDYCLDRLENHPEKVLPPTDFPICLNLTSQGLAKAKEKLKMFIKTFGPVPKFNPFPGRFFKLYMILEDEGQVSDYDLKDCLNILWSFLATFGKYFWHVSFTGRVHLSSSVSFYTTLYRCLSFMPNVKRLHIGVDGQSQDLFTQGVDTRGEFMYDSEEIKEFDLQNAHCPKLKHLQTLTMEGAACRIRNSVLNDNHHITSLHLRTDRGFAFTKPKVDLPRLKNFSMKGKDGWVRERELDEFQQCKWPLERVRLAAWNSFSDGPLVPKLFRTLECFGDTLKHVTLDSINDRWDPTWRLCLGGLETLRVSTDHNLKLDFLLPTVKTLKEFYASLHVVESGNVQFKKGKHSVGRLQGSKIWKNFVKLNHVQITKYNFRDEIIVRWNYSRARHGTEITMRKESFDRKSDTEDSGGVESDDVDDNDITTESDKDKMTD